MKRLITSPIGSRFRERGPYVYHRTSWLARIGVVLLLGVVAGRATAAAPALTTLFSFNGANGEFPCTAAIFPSGFNPAAYGLIVVPEPSSFAPGRRCDQPARLRWAAAAASPSFLRFRGRLRLPRRHVRRVAKADVFNMPAGQTSLSLVTVADPGNLANTAVMHDGTTGYGSVAYVYNIGKYDVTNHQYAAFLNAKAAASDPYGLWNTDVARDGNEGIVRTGNGPYTYRVKPGQGNQPVVYVSWYDAVRFVNWIQNGQGNGDTENGTYTIIGGGNNSGTVIIPSAAQRAAWAADRNLHWLLPSENEWYKAAFYKSGGTHAGYWAYPTRSDAAPASQAPPGGPNSANFFDTSRGYALTHSTSLAASFDYLTDVGAYVDAFGPYGTFDQCGDVYQWNEGDTSAGGDGS